jgi:hypothetical protein
MSCMEPHIMNDLNWWITVIEIPVMSIMFWLIWRTREDLTAHKLKIAEDYAERSDVKILEQRLTAHLLRIEAKLDVTALKTERMSHE